MRWFVSDTHFQHANIIEYCNRPFKDSHHMDEEICRMWNESIKQTDEVFFVGDVMMGHFDTGKEIVKKLNGRKTLILGNHDRSAKTMLECGFAEVHHTLVVKMSDGRRAILAHKPLPPSLINPYDFQIHGHHHSGPRVRGKRINVCIDLWNYRPVTENEIINLSLEDEQLDNIHVTNKNGRVSVLIDVDAKDLETATEHVLKLVREENRANRH